MARYFQRLSNHNPVGYVQLEIPWGYHFTALSHVQISARWLEVNLG